MLQGTAKNFHGEGLTFQFDRYPDVCPLCHHAVVTRPVADTILVGGAQLHESGVMVEMVFRCPHHDCSRFFIGRYSPPPPSFNVHGNRVFTLTARTPFNHVAPTFSDQVTKLSPTFVLIYGQAAAAESRRLDQVAGCGYRKALEFLVKDYCVSKDQASKEAIEGEFLGTTIRNRITDTNIKTCAERATWLGNDETHYVRKWADRDVSDLKTLIQLTVNWITNELVTKRYLNEMGQPRK
jgi:hypothetical protein